jgi:hypothetical protein
LFEIPKEDLHLQFASDSALTGANKAAEIINDNSGAIRAEKGDSITRRLIRTVRSLAPLTAMVAVASVAQAGPSIDMSGVTSVMQTVETACLLIGAIIVLISLVFSVFSFAGGNIMRGVTGVAGVLFGGLVIGLGPTWISSLTGQAVN